MAIPNIKFLEEFIDCYRNHPALWQSNSEVYRNKALRNEAWNVLHAKYLEYDPCVTIYEVKSKASSIRSSWWRERKKLLNFQKKGIEYNPSLWYYDNLDFLKYVTASGDEDVEEDPLQLKQTNSPQRKQEDNDASTVKPVVQQQIVRVHEPMRRDDAAIFADGWAATWRTLSRDQQIFAKRGIDELLLQGQLGKLTYDNVMRFNEFNPKTSAEAPSHKKPKRNL